MKRFIILSLLIIVASACNKKNLDGQGCEAKVCTQEFAAIFINFVDNADHPANIKDFSMINQRTGLQYDAIQSNKQMYTGVMSSYTIANDAMLAMFSTVGDDILISGTSTTTNQTKTAVVKVAGGCNCHVERKSGPPTIKFD